MCSQFNSKGQLIVWVDGACFQNHTYGPRKAGFGVWFNHYHPWNRYGPVRGAEATNNNAEIEAAIQAIHVCANNDNRKIEIRTDSNFVIQSVTEYFPTWKVYGWRKSDGNPITNLAKFKELDAVIDYYKMNITWTYVPGHQGIEGNVEADKLARKGANECN